MNHIRFIGLKNFPDRLLEAAERLGSSLDRYFDDLFVSIVLAPACLAAEQPGGMSISSRGSSQSAAEIEPAIKRKKSLSPKLPHLSLADGLDAPILVRLHFTEAMMVLLFNTLDAAQQKTVKQGFGDLLKRVENLEILGTPPGTLQAYREALGAMQNMLASNPQPEEMADALVGDFAKKYARPS